MLSEDKSTIEPFACQCTLSKLIQSNRSKLIIKSTEQRTTEKSSYTLYIITFDTLETKRRYSEFESFRNTLVKLYPAIFVPPIPGKHSISDYAHVHPQNRQKDERALIEKRKRMLSRFLYRLLDHPILSKEHILHQFLQPELIWSDLVSRPPLSNLKNPSMETPTANVSNDSHSFVSSIPGSSSITQAIPIPSVSYNLKDPDPKYTKSENLVNNQVQHSFIRFDRSQKKVLRRLGDLSNDYSEMGAAYNALSLDEVGVMANIIERLGISNDETCIEMRKLVAQLEIDFSEHVQEYVQYIGIAKQSNRYWYMKQIQLEMIGEALITKQTTLQTLLKTEGDAERLQATMMNDSTTLNDNNKHTNQVHKNNGNINNNEHHTNNIDYDIETHSIEDGFATIDTFSIPSREENDESITYNEMNEEDTTGHYPSGASVSAIRASKSRSKKWSSPRKLLNAMTYTLQGMIDVDPALTRRNQIGKLKETIWQLELTKQKTQEEVKQIGETIQDELQRLEKLKTTELNRMIIEFAKLHLQFCEKSMISWQETRKQVDNMSVIDD